MTFFDLILTVFDGLFLPRVHLTSNEGAASGAALALERERQRQTAAGMPSAGLDIRNHQELKV